MLGRAILVSALLGTALSGCKDRDRPTVPPGVLDAVRDRSAEPWVDPILEAMGTGDVSKLHGNMTPELRSRTPLDELARGARRLRERHGEALGIVEEKVHTEGSLRWYSGIVLYETTQARRSKRTITPILLQFATTSDGKLDRLAIREHWFLDRIAPPAEHYVPVNRFHFIARGQWYVIQGGRTRGTNKHHGHREQRYGYDLVVKKNGRQRPKGSPKRNSSYYCHGKDILAPASGVVVRVVEGVHENSPGERGRAGGNGLIIDHGFGEFSAIWHAIPGSLRVKEGDRVEVGQVLAQTGNSGRSTGPHIHYHVYHPDGSGDGFGLPAEFVDVYVDDRWAPRDMPIRGEYVQRARERSRRRDRASRPRVYVSG